MDVLRLAWSSYQSEESLRRERDVIQKSGFDYKIADEPGALSDPAEDADVLIVNSQFQVNESFLDQWGHSGTIIIASSGYDRVDLDACEERGIQVVRTPLARSNRVVEHTMTFLRSLMRDIPESNHRLRNGEWSRSEAFRAINRLSSLSVGILGYGVIGRTLKEKLEDKPYELLAWDPDKQGTIEEDSGVQLAEFDELNNRANIVSIHASLTPASRGLITRQFIDTMPDPSYIINTARGEIIDFNDLTESLEHGKLNGAALDVYPDEPYEPEERLPDNLICTPHSAGFGPGLLSDLRDEIVQVLKDIEANRKPRHCLT